MKGGSPFSRTRNKQVVRICKTIATLQMSYATKRELATRFKVSVRTIDRDFAALMHAGVRLLTDCQGTWTMN